MIRKTTELKIYGILMIFFCILDCVHIVRNLLETHSTEVTAFTYVILALRVLIALAKFWLGRQALCYANGNGKGTSHILLIKIGIAFVALLLVNDVVEAFLGIASFMEVISTIVSLTVMYSYYKAAKACL